MRHGGTVSLNPQVSAHLAPNWPPLPVCRSSWPDIGDHEGAGLVPVLMGTTWGRIGHFAFVSRLKVEDLSTSAMLTSHDEAEAAALFLQTQLDRL